MRLSRRTARCGTDLDERCHQDMKQCFKDMAKDNAFVPQVVQSADSLESPAPVRGGATFTSLLACVKDQTKLTDGRR